MKAEISKMVNRKKSRKINQTKGWFCEKVFTSYVSEKTSKFYERRQGNSLAVQGPSPQCFHCPVQVQSLVRDPASHVVQPKKKKSGDKIQNLEYRMSEKIDTTEILKHKRTTMK